MLYYSLQQMELANTRCDDFMKAEAFLNLCTMKKRLLNKALRHKSRIYHLFYSFSAKAYERLADFR